jgi:hypothetical protein
MVNGFPVEPPKRLRPIFDFHLANWNRTPDEIASDRASEMRRMKVLRETGKTYFTEEQLSSARDLIVFKKPLVSRADPLERAENFRRLVHPDPDLTPDDSSSWEWGPVILPLPRKL